MTTDALTQDRISMSLKERDALTILRGVLQGERSQAEAARLLDLSVRQVRHLQRKLEAHGDAIIVHGLPLPELLLPAAATSLPGAARGKVTIERRLDGTIAIRFGKHYLRYEVVNEGRRPGGSPPDPRSLTL